jgi:NAD(P)-dependent dehydrogenase (short-subunit alcohol dehydrogenase family)/acyl dehydratase
MADTVNGTLRLTEEHVRRFADASGDVNPLHVDEAFARRTPYGHCIAHGALVTIAALGSARPETLLRTAQLDIQFKQPVFPYETYAVSWSPGDGARSRIEVSWAGRAVAVINVTGDEAAPLPAVTPRTARPSASAPREHRLEDLDALSLSESYAPRLEPLAALAADVGAAGVPDALLAWLAAASYAVGMLIPGRDAIFAGARIQRAQAASTETLDASVTTADDRTGLVIVDATLALEDASARMVLQTFLRPAVPAPDRVSVGRHLAPSGALDGRNVLVVGASRGLGAALSGALATQGATVWAAFDRSPEPAERLRREFGPARIRPLQFDAGDVEQCRRALDSLREAAGSLDGIALCAAPPLYEAPLHSDTSRALLRSVTSSVAMALVPLAGGLELLAEHGWLVVTSSAAVADPPATWPHYVIAKGALEAAAAYCAQHTQARVLVARPPRMWTDATNTPLGRIGGAAPEQVAGGIVRWVLEGGPESGMTLLGPEQF